MIRLRAPDDDAAITQIIREVAPGWVTTEGGVRHRRLTTLERARRGDWVAEVDGEVAGWSSTALKTDGDRDDVAWVNVFVRPASAGRGLGNALWEPVEAHLLGLGVRRLLGDVTRQPAEPSPSSAAFGTR